MMGFVELLLLSIALAMDCFTISIVCGMTMERKKWSVILRLALLFGFFQAFMPFLGWLGTSYFRKYIEAYDHWIAFAMLLFLGIRMIHGAFTDDENSGRKIRPEKISDEITLAIATSIDALAVGISFACTGYERLSSLGTPLFTIGAVSFLFTILGAVLGNKFGSAINRKIKPELIGGLILIIIGFKILLSHLLA